MDDATKLRVFKMEGQEFRKKMYKFVSFNAEIIYKKKKNYVKFKYRKMYRMHFIIRDKISKAETNVTTFHKNFKHKRFCKSI